MSISGKGMRWENPSKDWSTRNRKKTSECFAKFIKRIRGGLKNIQLKFIVCVQGKIDFLSTIKRSYCRAWALSSQHFFLWYYPWLIWPRWVCAADLGWWPFHPLEFWTRRLFELRRLKKKWSKEYSLLVPPSPPPKFCHVSKFKSYLNSEC